MYKLYNRKIHFYNYTKASKTNFKLEFTTDFTFHYSLPEYIVSQKLGH